MASLMDLIKIAQYVADHPFITERELIAAGFSRDDLLRASHRTSVQRNYRSYGRTFYTTAP